VNYAGTHHLNLAPCRGGNVRNHFFVSASARFSKSSFGSTGTRSPFRNFVPGLAQSIRPRPVPPHSLAHGRLQCVKPSLLVLGPSLFPKGRRAFLRLLADFRFASFGPHRVRDRAQIPLAPQCPGIARTFG
jgi:hypothetical protein